MRASQRVLVGHVRLPRLSLPGLCPIGILAGIFLAASVINGCGSSANPGTVTPPAVTPPSSLAYAVPTLSATVGVAINPDTDSVAGSRPTFSVNPALPPGLAMDSTTGTVSGTPTAASSSAKYVVTAANSAGSATATLTIAVAIAPPSILTYANPAVNDTVGTAMTPDNPTVTGTVSAFSVDPALPLGLTLDATTGIISGTPRAFSPSSAYTVTAQNSSGSATAQVNIAVNLSEDVLLEQGHGDSILAIRATPTRVLSEDPSGHWVLWDYTSGTIVASGDGAITKDANQIDLAGQLAVVTTAQQVQLYSAADGHPILSIPAPAWWKLALDGSYICAGTSTALTAWSAAGDESFSLSGDYHNAIAFAASGQVQLADGPSGQDVIETDTFPQGASTISPKFSGTFHAWFLDGQRFLTNLANTVWVYSSGATQQSLVMLPSINGLTGQGKWIWITVPGYPSDEMEIYAVGATSPTAVFSFPIDSDSEYIASGNSVGVLGVGAPALTLVDLSGPVPLRSDFQTQPIGYLSSFAAASPSQWIVGNGYGVLVDGASLAATHRYFGFGAVFSISATPQLAAVSTAIGKILLFNPGTAAQTGSIDFVAGKLSLSSDGTVLAAVAPGLEFVPDSTLNLYSLPSGVLNQSFPSSYNSNGTPFLVDFSLSGSGTVLGQVLETYASGFQSFERTVTNLPTGSTIWSDSGNHGGANSPILLSPDGTHIAVATSGALAADFVTNIYLNGALEAAAAGTGEGWIDNGHMLAVNWTDGGQGFPEQSGSSIIDASGAVSASIPGTALPIMVSPQFFAPDRVYDAKTNTIYSLPTGEILWQGPVPQSAVTGVGAVAGSVVVFEAGHQVVATPAN